MSREVHVPFYERLGVQFPRPTHRFALSFRDVEDLLARRGVEVTHEAIRKCALPIFFRWSDRRLDKRSPWSIGVWLVGSRGSAFPT